MISDSVGSFSPGRMTQLRMLSESESTNSCTRDLPPECIAALDAALADLIPRLDKEGLEELRALVLFNNETVMEEMEKRAEKGQ